MAKKKKRPDQEEWELEQAYTDLTGYDLQKNRKPSGILPGLVCALVIVLSVCIIGIPFLLNEKTEPTLPPSEPTENPTIAQNTQVAGIELGGLTAQEAVNVLEQAFQQPMAVQIDGAVYTLDSNAAITAFDAKGAVEALMQSPTLFSLTDWMTLDTQAIQSQVEAWAEQFRQPAAETSWTVVGDKPSLEPSDEEPDCQTLVITKGSPASHLDTESLCQAILSCYGQGVFSVTAAIRTDGAEPYDLLEIYDRFYIAPVDAVMDGKTFVVSGGSYGYGFDLAEAQNAFNNAPNGEIIEIPFRRISPDITAKSLQDLLYRDVLSSSSTPHTDQFNRNNNLKLACQAINGMILFPGDEFSFNDALGERTTAKGYLPAGSYVAGATVDTVGGGICQVSSTLYHCSLMADLEITLRDCHMYAVSYLPLGIDATINWGSYDYRFRNNTNFPIRIEAWVADGNVNIRLIGTDEKDYYVEVESVVDEVYPYHTTYKEMYADNPYGYVDGEQITSPYTGYGVYTYRCKYDKTTGEQISREYEDYSEYWHRDEVIVKIINK